MADFSTLPPEERDRVLAKLAKLKALAECPTGNVNETATAAATMTRLMLEYRIEVAELLPAAAIVEEEATPEVKNRAFPAWQSYLLSSLAKAHDCVSFETRDASYYPWGEKVYAVRLSLLGPPEDVARTRQLYLYCLEAIDRLARGWGGRKASVAQRNDFRMGASIAIGDRVLQEREAVRAEEAARARQQGHQESRALAVLDRQLEEVQHAAKKRGVTTVTRRTRPAARQAYDAGYEAGARLSLPGDPTAPLPDPYAAAQLPLGL